MNGAIIKHMQTDMTHDLECINQYTRRPFTEQEVYTFSVVLCDNEIDRDFERFSVEALHTLSQLFLGKTGIFDHNMKTGNQAARIYDTAMETMEGKRTSFGRIGDGTSLKGQQTYVSQPSAVAAENRSLCIL